MKNLFTYEELKQSPLTQIQKKELLKELKVRADFGAQYLYDVKITAAMLHLSYDEMQTLIYSYKIDAVAVRASIKIPWWSISEYIIDPADDLEEALHKYVQSLPHRRIKKSNTTPHEEAKFCVYGTSKTPKRKA